RDPRHASSVAAREDRVGHGEPHPPLSLARVRVRPRRRRPHGLHELQGAGPDVPGECGGRGRHGRDAGAHGRGQGRLAPPEARVTRVVSLATEVAPITAAFGDLDVVVVHLTTEDGVTGSAYVWSWQGADRAVPAAADVLVTTIRFLAPLVL